jgi:hypothetical protein
MAANNQQAPSTQECTGHEPGITRLADTGNQETPVSPPWLIPYPSLVQVCAPPHLYEQMLAVGSQVLQG